MTQLRIVSTRTLTAYWRMPDYEFTRLFNHISISLFTSLTFLMLGNNLLTLQYRVFDIFVATVLPGESLCQYGVRDHRCVQSADPHLVPICTCSYQ